MPDLLDSLLEAHVQHELGRWQGDALQNTLDEYVGALFRWFGEVTLRDVITESQVVGVIERYVIELRVSGGITELNGELSRLAFTSHATACVRLDQILTPESYREFSDKVLALEGIRRKLIALIAESSTVRSLGARFIARAVLDLIALSFPLPSRLTPSVLTSLSSRAAAAILPALGYLAEKALARHRERITRSGDEPLGEVELVPRHRHVDRLECGQLIRRDKQFYRPSLTTRATDEAEPFELNDHLVDTRCCDAKEALEVGFRGRLAVEE